MKKKRRVIATGVFSIIHPGHILFLKEAKKLGDELIVIVARDVTVKKKKGKILIPENQRLKVIKSLKYVDNAILGSKEDMLKPIEKIKPDIIALGKNQKIDENFLKKEFKKRGINAKIVRIKSYWNGKLNSSKKIIKKIRGIYCK